LFESELIDLVFEGIEVQFRLQPPLCLKGLNREPLNP